MVTIMASQAHRWPGDNTPLTGLHGGSKAAAAAAVKEAKQRLYERAQRAARAVIQANTERKDRLRPSRQRGLDVYDSGSALFIPMPLRNEAACRAAVTPGQKRSFVSLPRALAVWDKSNGICVYCDKPMLRMPGDPLSFTIDHDIPKCRKGSNHLDNLVGAHARCNNEKGSLTGDEYRAVLKVRFRK